MHWLKEMVNITSIKFQFLMEGSSTIFILFLLLLIIIFIFSNFYSKRNKVLRALKRLEFKKILLCKENETIKIKGKAASIDQSLISPIGKKKCVYYKIEIEQKQSNGKSSSWNTIIEEEKFQDFIIDSQGQKAIVMTNTPKDAKQVYLTQDVAYNSGTWNDAPKFLEDYLKTHNEKSTGIFGLNKSIRYKEGTIEIEEEIAVMGIGNWKESDHILDRYSSKILFLSGDIKNKLVITDDPSAIDGSKK